MLSLRWFRDRTIPGALARDHGTSRATAYLYRDEVIDVGAEQAPGLHQALERGMLTGRWRTLQHITASPARSGTPPAPSWS